MHLCLFYLLISSCSYQHELTQRLDLSQLSAFSRGIVFIIYGLYIWKLPDFKFLFSAIYFLSDFYSMSGLVFPMFQRPSPPLPDCLDPSHLFSLTCPTLADVANQSFPPWAFQGLIVVCVVQLFWFSFSCWVPRVFIWVRTL